MTWTKRVRVSRAESASVFMQSAAHSNDKVAAVLNCRNVFLCSVRSLGHRMRSATSPLIPLPHFVAERGAISGVACVHLAEARVSEIGMAFLSERFKLQEPK